MNPHDAGVVVVGVLGVILIMALLGFIKLIDKINSRKKTPREIYVDKWRVKHGGNTNPPPWGPRPPSPPAPPRTVRQEYLHQRARYYKEKADALKKRNTEGEQNSHGYTPSDVVEPTPKPPKGGSGQSDCNEDT